MKVITAPTKKFAKFKERSLFLAGGITNCPDWQTDILKMIKGDIVVYNPRRKKFPINDPLAAQEQIEWEYNRLRSSDLIIFWFARGSLNPIVLYELGMWGNSRTKEKTIFVGCDRQYERKRDVEIQTHLANPYCPVAETLELLALMVNNYISY